MPLYIDGHLILDTDHIICAHPGQGSGERDGQYWIMLLVAVGGKPKRLFVDFPTQAARDTAFTTIGQLMQADEVFLPLILPDTD